ncbi:MAG: Asp23/Gls24 family envelope stress response protein [Actinomycetota bacterium]|nr:Asp23/Gls24 family envelope stress response protein [Actinomycetota bacterium]
MTDTTSENTLTTSSSSPSASSALVTQHGRTTITDAVVSKIAGISTRDVTGVYALGGGAARAVGALRERIPGSRTNHSQGVSVEVGERQAAIDVQIVAEYGVAIADLAEAVRRNVIASLERMTGLEVTEVNITVQDVHLESDDSSEETDDEPQQQPRVQ